MKSIEGKIKVFISSKTGDRAGDLKYRIARKAVKEILDSTNLFSVYSFEDEGASVRTAEEHYTRGLESSDVCIFLIDNKDGVPLGVQKELETVSKHKIPVLYYFCDKYKKAKTQVQLDLEQAYYPKHYTVTSFENFIEVCPGDLIKDVLDTFKVTGKNEAISSLARGNVLQDEEDSEKIEVSKSKDTESILFIAKKTSKNVECRNYFSELLLRNTNYDFSDKTLDIDYYSAKFLRTMFEGLSIDDFNMNLFLEELEKVLPPIFYKVIEKRWASTQNYYLGKYDNSLSLLNEAYSIAIENKENIPVWLIQDILIDIRNREDKIFDTKNMRIEKNFGQEELDKIEEKYHNPVLDKYEKDLLNWIENERQKNEIRPYNSWSSYGDISFVTDFIADFYFQAMVFGSYTQLARVYLLVQKLSYQMSRATGYWPSSLMMIKTTLVNLDYKKTKQIIRDFSQILSTINDDDAREIYDFTSNIHLSEDNFAARLIAMSEVGYYLNDRDFDQRWNELKDDISNWITEKNSMVSMERLVFDCVKRINERIDDNYIVNLALSVIDSEKKRYHDSALDLLTKRYINYKEITQENSNKLIDVILKYANNLINPSDANKTEKIKIILMMVNTMDDEHLELMESVINSKWPAFYQNEYLFERNRDKKSEENLLIDFTNDIEKRNESQGMNGVYSLFATRPSLSAINVIEASDVIPEKSVLNQLFNTVSSAILSENQIATDKIDAYSLAIYLVRRYSFLVKENQEIVEKIMNNNNFDRAREMTFNKVDNSVLILGNLLLLEAIGKNKYMEIIEVVTTLNEPGSIIDACKLIKIFLNGHAEKAIKPMLVTLFVQCTLIWKNFENIDVRWHNTVLQLELFKNKKHQKVLGESLYLTAKNDNGIVKSQIIHSLQNISQVNPHLGKKLSELAKNDANFVIRKIVEMKKG